MAVVAKIRVRFSKVMSASTSKRGLIRAVTLWIRGHNSAPRPNERLSGEQPDRSSPNATLGLNLLIKIHFYWKKRVIYVMK